MRKILAIGLFLILALALAAPAEAFGRRGGHRGHRRHGQRHATSGCFVQTAGQSCANGACRVK